LSGRSRWLVATPTAFPAGVEPAARPYRSAISRPGLGLDFKASNARRFAVSNKPDSPLTS